MSGELTDLVRDAASLHQFIGSIYKRRDEPERTHREATVTFLKYIRDLGENAQSFLQGFIQRVGDTRADLSLARFERQRLTTIRAFWNSLHELVRPAEDAHTLSIPVAYVEFLERLLSEIPGLEGCDVVVSHTSELNYFFRPRADLRYYAQSYEAIIGGLPAFPKKLALIGMPYSQATSLFLNLVICHELGHFAFEELGLEKQLARDIDSALKTLPDYESMSEPDLSWGRERLKYWSEEIYCDRFAIGLMGPAYSFAYIELFDMIGTSDTDDVGEFSDTHPADACRFKEHADQLQQGDWWSLLDENPRTSYVDLMKKLAGKAEADYVFESEEKPALARPVLAAFLKLKPKVAALVTGTFQERLRRFRGDIDREEINLVRIYLSHGIVPSTLVQGGKERSPDAVALINAAYLFYLESLPALMEKIANQNESSLTHRSKWAERVEMWTLKALEDLRLLQTTRN
jgi:hypothetical protein